MADISPRGELKLTLDFEGRKFVSRAQVDGTRSRRGIAGLLELVPALYMDLLKTLERFQDREESRK